MNEALEALIPIIAPQVALLAKKAIADFVKRQYELAKEKGNKTDIAVWQVAAGIFGVELEPA